MGGVSGIRVGPCEASRRGCEEIPRPQGHGQTSWRQRAQVDISWDRRPAGVVVHVVFDNARLNVLNPPALLDLTEAFLSLGREDDIRVVVFSGAGGNAFIGGMTSTTW